MSLVLNELLLNNLTELKMIINLLSPVYGDFFKHAQLHFFRQYYIYSNSDF